MGQFPPAPEHPIRTVSNFFENSQRYLLVKVHHRYQRHWYQGHRRQISAPSSASVAATDGKFATGFNDTGGKFAVSVNGIGGKFMEKYQAADSLKRT
jgi:hypothetical protein